MKIKNLLLAVMMLVMVGCAALTSTSSSPPPAPIAAAKAPRPSLLNVISSKDAGLVLTVKGEILRVGPHIDKDPVIYTKDGKAHHVTALQPIPPPVGSTPNPPKIVQRKRPTDIGTTLDITGFPLFSPLSGEGNQGQVGDCYMLSPWNSLGNADWFRKQICFTRADGTNGFTFRRDINNPVTIVGDWIIGSAFTRPDPVTRACSDCILEIDYTNFRSNAYTYASTDEGSPSAVFTDFGCPSIYVTPASTAATVCKAALAHNYGVCPCTNPFPKAGVSLIGSHCYHVVNIYTDAAGKTWWVLHNPWGFDGIGNDGNYGDGLVTISDDDMRGGSVSTICVQTGWPIGFTPPPPPPIPGDANGDSIVDGADFDVWFTHLQTHTTNAAKDGDFDGSGLVDGADFDVWFTHLSVTSTGAAAGTWTAAQKANLSSQVSPATYAKLFPPPPPIPAPTPRPWWSYLIPFWH